MSRTYPLLLVLGLAAASLAAQNARPGAPGSGQQPSRDTPAQNQAPTPTGRLIGRVVASDTGRPIKRARVFVSAPELPGGRGTLTDDNGVFDIAELPAGRYTLSASKSGFITLSYGQRRPLQSGTPLQLADSQQLKGVDFQLPRGGVITGHVFDETGDAMPGVMVSVMRYQYMQGDRRLTPAGTAQTDDKGQYRVWGLNPGDYYVSALSRADMGNAGGRGGGRGGRGGGSAAAIIGAIGGALGPNVAALLGGGGEDQERLTYAPTYYPGVPSVNEARALTVGVSQELTDIDFSLQLVRTAHIAGRVLNADATPVTSGNVQMTAAGAGNGSGRGGPGINYGSRIDWDGSFTISNVPPGTYTLRARGTDDELPQFAAMPLTVSGADMADVAVILRPGGTLSGTITFQGTQPPSDPTQIRIAAPSADPADALPTQNARVEKDGKFAIQAVPAGEHLIRPNGGGALRGWTLKEVTIGGRDTTDAPIDVKSGETVGNVTVVFTDKQSEINGTIADQRNVPITDYTVLAFSTDPTFWRSQSRHIMTTRPDQNGKFRLRGLPPGEYYLATVDPAEQGEWFEPTYLDEHRAAASRLTLGEGDVKTQDFRLRR